MQKYGWVNLALAAALVAVVGCGGGGGEDVETLQDTVGGRSSASSIGGRGGGFAAAFYNDGDGSRVVQDATIEAAAPDIGQGNSPECVADGRTQERSCVMIFDLTRIPSNATVTQASLYLNIIDKSKSTYEFFALKRGRFGAVGTTWNNARLFDAWAIPGAKGAADREAVPFFAMKPNTLGFIEFAFDATGVAQVQRWVREPPANNRGFVIARADASDGFAMTSSEAAEVGDRPLLMVRYQ